MAFKQFVINNQEVIAEKVTKANLPVAKTIDTNAEIGDYCVTLPDQTLGIVSGAVFEKLTGLKGLE